LGGFADLKHLAFKSQKSKDFDRDKQKKLLLDFIPRSCAGN
jgi:hypothetical protein